MSDWNNEQLHYLSSERKKFVYIGLAVGLIISCIGTRSFYSSEVEDAKAYKYQLNHLIDDVLTARQRSDFKAWQADQADAYYDAVSQ